MARKAHGWATVLKSGKRADSEAETGAKRSSEFFNDPQHKFHYSGDGAIVYKHAYALGCEGIVSKRLGSPYRGGRADCWIKVKNPAAPAVLREAEEEWNT